MVRGIVGTMLNVGKGKISPPAFGNILEEKDSSKANFAVPPHGLYLKEITYGNKL
jgi:tRNA pseudouridine38-40 synthase